MSLLRSPQHIGWSLFSLTALFLLTALGATACVGSQGPRQVGPSEYESGQPIVAFPQRKELDALLSKPVPKEWGYPEFLTESWEFSEELPTGTHPWDESLAHFRSEHPQIRMGDDLNCLAHQVAAFYDETQKLPDGRFMRFAGARCGSGSPQVSLSAQSTPLGGDPSDEWVWSQMKEAGYLTPLDELVTAGYDAVGLSVFRTKDQATMAVVGALEPAHLKVVTPRPDDKGRVVVQGVLKQPIDALEVIINSGEVGFNRCPLVSDGKRFEARCKMAKSDPSAWFEVVTLEREAVLSSVAARGMAVREGRAQGYEPIDQGPPVASEADFTRDFARALGAVRNRGGLAPVTLNAPQSEEATKLAPHLMRAHQDGDTGTQQQITMGLMAGWHVAGDIRDGNLFLMGQATRSPTSFLAAVLESPMGRSVLLDPEARVLSVGASFHRHSEMALVVNSWQLYQSQDHSKDREKVLVALDEARTRAGRSHIVIGTNLHELEEAITMVQSGQRSPHGAVNRAAQLAAQRLGRNVWGLVVEGYNLEHLAFPPELTHPPQLFVEVAVTHYRPEGAAWAQLAVLVLLVPDVAT